MKKDPFELYLDLLFMFFSMKKEDIEKVVKEYKYNAKN